MSANFGNFFIIGILSVMLPFIPLTPLQILLTNFITDLPLFGIEFDRVDDFEVKQPAHYRLRELFILLVALGAVAAIFSFVVFFLFRQSGKEFVQTIIYLQTTISGILIFYSIRTNGWFFRSAPAGIMNVLVGFALFLAYLSLQHPFSSLVGLVPLSLQTICFLLCINIIYLFVNDFVKIIVMKKAFEKQ